MRMISLCDGIGSAHLAARVAGWTSVASSEIDVNCQTVVTHHYPAITHLGDMLSDQIVGEAREIAPDVIVASTPCQAFSTIGLRQSLQDERGNLTLALVRIVEAANPKWLIWENVPGVLTTSDNAFGHFIGGLLGLDEPCTIGQRSWPEIGFVRHGSRRVAWRVLDSQGFVPQKRRRVFVVMGLDGRDPCPVLFETVRQSTTPLAIQGWITAHADRSNSLSFDWQAAGAGNDASFKGKSRRWIVRPRGTTGTIATTRTDAVLYRGRITKLSPKDSLRLMGFPEDYLDISTKRISTNETVKQKMCGNTIVTFLLAWIFTRITRAEAHYRVEASQPGG